MPWSRIGKGKPFVFHEFAFFSPKQFDKPVEIQDKDFLFKIKICNNSGRVFTGPFMNEVIGEEEIGDTELNKMMELVNNTPNIIMYGTENILHDDSGGLQRYYG